jgi:hypothetical protein
MVWVLKEASGVLALLTLVMVLFSMTCAPPVPSTDMPK